MRAASRVLLWAALLGACTLERPVPFDPGHVTLRRLNRTEYRRTVQDLLGTKLDPSRDFPVDDHAHGFDNNPDALSLSPLQAELYAVAAEGLVDELIGRSPFALYQAEELLPQTGHRWRDTWWRLWEGSLTAEVTVSAPGRYRVTVRAAAENGTSSAALSLGTASSSSLELRDVLPRAYRVELDIAETGVLPLTFALTSPPVAGEALKAVRVDWLRVEGPLKEPSQAYGELFGCECARDIVARFAERAFRRPVPKPEIDALMKLVEPELESGVPFDAAVAPALEAVLQSPHFLFRVEVQRAGPARWLDDHELATRLSYLLWSSMPDAALFQRADEGRLTDDAVLSQEVRRMLRSPKAAGFIEDFGGQWLATRALAAHEVDPDTFPSWTPALRDAMAEQSRRFFSAFLTERRPARELLTADFTYVDPVLASHYGLPDVEGPTRITLSDSSRRGLLGQGAFLAFTSYPSRTSPVQRGKWVLSQLLCRPPSPPPPGVEGLPTPAQVMGSVRQRLEAHVSNPMCATCHRQMDPIGFGLEGFDGIGRSRTEDLGYAIDARGELPDGRTFDGPVELSQLVASDERLYTCITEHLFTYAVGRAPQAEDSSATDAIERGFTEGGGSLEALVDALVHSPAFRARQGVSP